jgi:tetratricopeptide (TPR) repeat protein
LPSALNFRRAAILVAAILAAVSPALAAADQTVVPPIAESIAQFAASLEQKNKLDPQSPDTLTARLDFADFLATAAEQGDCQPRLRWAQQQLDLAGSDPAIEVALPSGTARVSAVDYRIHTARAACGSIGAAAREQELRAALDSARRAVDLYREAFDAVAMVTMQFNAATASASLGDTGMAVSALQKAIDMDREYGFDDDARDNYELLLQWRNQQAGPEQVDALMDDFPQRSATLAFGWSAGQTSVSLQSDYTQIASVNVVRIRNTRTARRQVSRGFNSWIVSYDPSEAHYDLGNPPSQDPFVQGFAISLAGMLLQFHDFGVARNGQFEMSKGTFKFRARVRAEGKSLAKDIDSASNHAPLLARRVSTAINAALSLDFIEPRVAEDYNLETGTWIGATLEQGVWYEMAAPLSWQLAPTVFVSHKIEFAYTRQVPCEASSTESKCVEIILHATLDPSAVHLPPAEVTQMWSAMHMRLVTDPTTLQSYSCEIRRYAYWFAGKAGGNRPLLESEKTLAISTP